MENLAWNGQKILLTQNGKDYIKCPVCNNCESLISLQSSAYFDKYNHNLYVHYDCLSSERKAEI